MGERDYLEMGTDVMMMDGLTTGLGRRFHRPCRRVQASRSGRRVSRARRLGAAELDGPRERTATAWCAETWLASG